MDILLTGTTATGWRGLRASGAIFVVEGSDFPDGEIYLDGHLAVLPKPDDRLGEYCKLLFTASSMPNRAAALVHIEAASVIADTTIVKFQRALALLSIGRWKEGYAAYAAAGDRRQCQELLDKGMRRWQGEDLAGHRILLVSDHGLGDALMTLRYVPRLTGADVRLWLPPELVRLGSQFAEVVEEPTDADYFCSLFLLPGMLGATPQTVTPQSYLIPDPALVRYWRRQIPQGAIGVAWAPGHSYSGDYPRFIAPELLRRWLPGRIFVSVQKGEAPPGILMTDPIDLASCAALMTVLDEIVTVDTAAVHLGGALGHPKINLLLDTHWASWRWLAPWYKLTTWRLDLTRPANELLIPTP